MTQAEIDERIAKAAKDLIGDRWHDLPISPYASVMVSTTQLLQLALAGAALGREVGREESAKIAKAWANDARNEGRSRDIAEEIVEAIHAAAKPDGGTT